MARIVREEIEAVVTDDYAALTRVMADARQALRARGRSVDADRWRAAVDAELRLLVATGRPEEARQRLLERLGQPEGASLPIAAPATTFADGVVAEPSIGGASGDRDSSMDHVIPRSRH